MLSQRIFRNRLRSGRRAGGGGAGGRRRLGQHFLASSAVLRQIIAAAALAPGDTVLEIGAGTGALTRAMAERAGTIVAVEKDRELCRELAANFARTGISNVRLICGDIIKIPFAELGIGPNYRVIANIPYYLTSRLIRLLLESAHPPAEMLLMVQREVADRIVARPPNMNLLALAVQAQADARILFPVPKTAFRPMPAVNSAFVRIRPQSKNFFQRTRIQPKRFFAVVRAAFGGKRKILANTLAAALNVPKAKLARTLQSRGLEARRPQELSLEDWGKLIRSLNTSVLP